VIDTYCDDIRDLSKKVSGGGNTASWVHDVTVRWVVSFTPPRLFSRGKVLWYPL